MACDPQDTITAADIDGLNKDIATIDAVVESSLDTTTTKNGKVINTLLGQLKLLGFIPPVTYAASIVFGVSDNTKTVDEAGVIYAPLPSALPFTTSGTFIGDDDARFFVIQGLTPQNLGNFAVLNFGTVADMEADTELSIGDHVAVEDYALGNESGFLFFKIVAAATGTDDGGRFIDLPGSGFQAMGNFPATTTPKFWGATGDGVTDDNAAISAADAYNADGFMVFTPGTYLVSTDRVITASWLASSRDSVTIKATGISSAYQTGGEVTPTMIRWGNGSGGKTKTISDITFDLNSINELSWIAESSLGGPGFVGGNSHSIFQHCRVINGTDNGDHSSTLGYAIHFDDHGGILNGILVGATFINLLMENIPRSVHLNTTTDDIKFISPRFLNTGTSLKSSRWPIFISADANVNFDNYFFNFTNYDTVNWTVDRVSWIFCGAFGPHTFTNGFVEDISVGGTANTNNFLYLFAFGSNTQCLDSISDLTINWGSSALLAVCSVTETSTATDFTRDLSVKNITCRTNLANNVIPPLLFELFQPTANAGKPKYTITFDNVDVFPKLYDWRTGTLAGDESSTLVCTYRGKRYNSVTRSNAPGTTEDFPQDMETIWIPSGDFRVSTSFPGAAEADYGGTNYRCFALDGTTREDITANLGFNSNRNTKFIGKIYWTNLGAGAGTVQLQLSFLSAASGATLVGSGIIWTETVTALADDVLSITADVQTQEFTWNKGEFAAIRVIRQAGSDTLTNDIGILGVMLEPVSF